MPSINFNQADIVAYATIEPRIFSRDLKPVIKAQVHDALWMLTQQWRVGEFKGDDAGSLIKAKVETQSTLLNRFQSKYGAVEPFNNNVPLETKAERLPLVYDLGMQLTIGYQWLKLLRMHQLGSMFDTNYITAFPIDNNAANTPQQASNYNAVQVRNTMAGNMMNGQAFVTYLQTNNAKNIVNSSNNAYNTAIDNAQADFIQWFANTYHQPLHAADSSWSAEQLEYQFSVSAPDTTANNAPQTVLLADKYTSGDVDWYSFDLAASTAPPLTETPANSISNSNNVIWAPVVQSYIPHTIEFKGMPKGRWWEFEDKNIDLAKMLAQKQDVSKLVVMEFGLIYSNDWFIIPHTIPDGSFNKINGLVVTDVFGRQHKVDRAGAGANNWQQWNMFNTSRKQQGAASYNRMLMVPSLKNRMESEPLEKVMFLRDEMANMVWGVEEVVPNELMGGMDGRYAGNELQKYLAENFTPPAAATYVPNVAEHRFRLSNSVPENWIPFIATKQNPGSLRNVKLQRAAIPRYIGDDYTTEVVRPRTNILSPGIATNQAYYINEEETSRSGFVVSTSFQRTRWYNGRTYTWMGRKVQSGRGEGNSGLKFDTLTDKEADEGAADIPLTGMTGWWKADNPANQVTSGRVTMLKDASGHNLNLVPYNGSQGPESTSYNGVAAMLFNSNILYNSNTTLPIHVYDDFTVFHVGNNGIGRGFDDAPGSTWSFALTPHIVDVVLVNAGQLAYEINSGLQGDPVQITTATLEQRDPNYYPFAARLCSYDRSGNLLPVANNPYVIPNNNYLRDTTGVGFVMGAVAISSQHVNGYTFETIVYNRKLSSDEIQKVLTYLKAKYPFV